MTRIAIAVFVIACIAAAVVLGTGSVRHDVSPDDWFSPASVDLEIYDLFDLGLMDFNGDGHLDIFTVNHSARQSLLLGSGDWNLTDALADRRLSQDAGFPGLEDTLDTPVMAAPGLYVFRRERLLTFVVHSADTGYKGTLTIPWPVEIHEAPSTTIVEETENDGSATSTSIEFELGAGESLVVVGTDDIVEVPHGIELSRDVDLESVFVGHGLVNPSQHTFDLMWRDRHGFVLADLGGDASPDLLIARGGIKGQLDTLPVEVSDELLVQVDNRFVERSGDYGFTKDNCPARQVSAVDVDADGDLDVYISCGRGDIPDYPNQLFIQDDERFSNAARRYGLDHPTASVYAWLDADLDGDMDLLAIEDGQLFDYRNNGQGFDKTAVTADLPQTAPYKLAVADFDNDGDLDAYAAYRRDSYLILNDAGNFSLAPANTRGLPEAARTANWVDYDNDGWLDLHVLPGGLYRQEAPGDFVRTGFAAYDVDVLDIVDARASWLDADDDGGADVILAVKAGPTLLQRIQRRLRSVEPDLTDHWSSAVLQSGVASDNRWLQIDIQGSPGNREAIGAMVYVTAGDTTQLRQIGTGDGAHFGQGHYRAYFGLAGNATATEVRVVWPDGAERRLTDVSAGQRIRISREDAG